jgi:hypothetical protein
LRADGQAEARPWPPAVTQPEPEKAAVNG